MLVTLARFAGSVASRLCLYAIATGAAAALHDTRMIAADDGGAAWGLLVLVLRADHQAAGGRGCCGVSSLRRIAGGQGKQKKTRRRRHNDHHPLLRQQQQRHENTHSRNSYGKIRSFVYNQSMSLIIKPIELKDANVLVSTLHRHHKPIVGHRYSVGAWDTVLGKYVGAAIVGRPVARLIDKSKVVEVTRLVTDGSKNACSLLYSAAARVARELGYEKIQTYILDSEPGTSLIASGWVCEDADCGGGFGWHSRDGRTFDQPICKKQRWAKILR